MHTLHQDDTCPICFLRECQHNSSNETRKTPNHVDKNKKNGSLTNGWGNIDRQHGKSATRDNNQKSSNSNLKLPHLHDPGNAVAESPQELAEDIAHVLKIIGDNLDSSTNEVLSNDIVLALRNIGDTLDMKIGSHNKSFIMAALGESGIKIGQLLLKVTRPQSFVGTVLCTSLQLLLRYNRL